MNFLIVEDRPEYAANINDFIIKNGHECDIAINPNQFTELLKTRSYDYLILDTDLDTNGWPNIHGVEFVLELKRQGIEIPPVILTCLHPLVKEMCQEMLLRKGIRVESMIQINKTTVEGLVGLNDIFIR